MTITREIWMPIYESLFDPTVRDVVFNNRAYPIKILSNNCRFVDYEGARFIEQNKGKIRSKWAKMAKEGHKIMWIVSPDFTIWYGRVVDTQLTILP